MHDSKVVEQQIAEEDSAQIEARTSLMLRRANRLVRLTLSKVKQVHAPDVAERLKESINKHTHGSQFLQQKCDGLIRY